MSAAWRRSAFTPRRVAVLREHIRQITEGLVDELAGAAAALR